MSRTLTRASEFYRLARSRRPAGKILVSAVCGMVILGLWAALTPINESVVHSVKIVPRGGGSGGNVGALSPSTSISGKVVEVLVSESQEVSSGDLLVLLDSNELSILKMQEIEKSKSLKQQVDAKEKQKQLSALTHVKETADLKTQCLNEERLVAKSRLEREIKIKRATVEFTRLTKEYQRALKLKQQRAISQSEVDTLLSEMQIAKEDVALANLPVEDAKVAEIKSRLETLDSSHRESLHQLGTEILVLKNQLSASISEIELLVMKLGQCEVRAECDGLISGCVVRPGDWVKPGPIGITVSQKGYMAEAFLPSGLIGDVKIGDQSVISLDGIDWLVHGSLFGTVSMISPDLIQEEVVLGDGSTVMVDGYRVWMKLDANPDFRKWSSVRLGMTGTVEINTGKKQLAIYLLEKAVGHDWIPAL